MFQNYCTPLYLNWQQLFEIFLCSYFKNIVFISIFLYILNEVIVLNGFEKVKEKKKRAIK
ncbi:TetR family transcriptional regulator, partial [Bacillus pseudomycoides]